MKRPPTLSSLGVFVPDPHTAIRGLSTLGLRCTFPAAGQAYALYRESDDVQVVIGVPEADGTAYATVTAHPNDLPMLVATLEGET